MVTPDGKPRTERLWILDPLGPPRVNSTGNNGRRGLGTGGCGSGSASGPPPPALDETSLEEMTLFLEEKGGAMDYGKFANAFPGVKKSQLEPHFVLVPESINSGGRWQVTLPGVDPMSPEEREARERVDVANREPKPPSEEPLLLEPSNTLRLIGCIKKWDSKKGFGFVAADGADDVFVHMNDLPPEVQGWKNNFEGVELTFELIMADDHRLKATNVHLLLQPDMEGGWQLRRV